MKFTSSFPASFAPFLALYLPTRPGETERLVLLSRIEIWREETNVIKVLISDQRPVQTPLHWSEGVLPHFHRDIIEAMSLVAIHRIKELSKLKVDSSDLQQLTPAGTESLRNIQISLPQGTSQQLCLCGDCAPSALRAIEEAIVPRLKLWVSPRTTQRHFSLQVEKEGSAGEEAREAQKFLTTPGYRCVPPWFFKELVEKVLVKNCRDLAIHEGVPDLDTSSSAHAAAARILDETE
jgi:hypothetical protein